jgi:RNA polymerase-binding transcription factor DksA
MGFDREAIKIKLLERKKDLEQELQRLVEDRVNGDVQEVRDPIDQATQSELDDFSISLE